MGPGEPHTGGAGPRGDRLWPNAGGHSILPGPRQPCPHLSSRVCEAQPALHRSASHRSHVEAPKLDAKHISV